MGFRRHVNKRRSTNGFKKRAKVAHRLNFVNPMRGGIRL